MKTVISISVSKREPWNFNFQQQTELKLLFPEFEIIDFDNYSDSTLLTYINKLLDESEKLIVILELNETEELGNIPVFLRKLIKYRKKLQVFYLGEQNHLQKIIAPYKAVKVTKVEEALVHLN
ncbi:hypothetical protein [Chondrinema litorale]|uniref:hypothetical protein n=1 Tax=Chondrinema litorale TaxID=2994555 RepID=UPI002542BCD3|nr:hypothetical protein [Chondrinema litorale]UZR92768.1 hypothetical protein OQ292_12960 [Chondrinema litorale]